MSGSSPVHDQFIRKISLVVAAGGQGIDLSNLRIRFNVTLSETLTYNLGNIRVYNLADTTLAKILGATGTEYTRVILQAGYEHGAFAIIFDGTIKQFTHGKENNVDSFLDIYAADGDILNFATINQTLAGPVTQEQQIEGINKAVTPFGLVTQAPGSADQIGGVLPRGKVRFGMVFDQLRGIGKTRLTTWSIQRGVITEIPLRG